MFNKRLQRQRKYKSLFLQPLWCCCVDCVIHHQQDEREEQKYIYVAQASNNKRDCDAWSLLLLAATVQSFAHMLLGISDRNTIKVFMLQHCFPLIFIALIQENQNMTLKIFWKHAVVMKWNIYWWNSE